MKKYFVLISTFLVSILFIFTVSLVYASSSNKPISEDIKNKFDEMKKDSILNEVADAGYIIDSSSSLTEVINEVDQLGIENKINSDVKDHVNKLKQAEYIVILANGEVYSSERGYLGEAERVPEDQPIVSSAELDNDVSIKSQTNPTPSEIEGGTTGAFARKQLKFVGFNAIQGDVRLPNISGLGSGEQPWVYFGIDYYTSKRAEGGFSYQAGQKKWLPYIKAGGYKYQNPAVYYNDGTTNHVKMYAKSATNDVRIEINYQVVTSCTTAFSYPNYSTLSVKYMTTIGKWPSFNGTNIVGKSMNQRWDNVTVCKYNSSTYYNFSNYPLYSEWKNNMWYGSIDCTSSYIHRDSNGVHIYK